MDAFTIVKRKSRRKRLQEEYDETSPLYFEKFLRRVEVSLEQFEDEPQLSAALSAVDSALALLGLGSEIPQIFCYGLGSPSNSKSSLYQLCLVIKIGGHLGSRIAFHDPVFSLLDVRALESLKCSLIEPDSGSRKVDALTMFFLPHAPRFVIDNILSSNWGPNLSKCVIFCDNLMTIVDNTPSRVLKDSHPFLYESHHFVDVFEVENRFKFQDVFNDFAVHVFSPSRLAALDRKNWDKKEILSDIQ